MEIRTIRTSEQACEEKQDTVCAVVPCPIYISTVQNDLVDPFEGRAEFFPASVRVEQGQDVDAGAGVELRSIMSKVGLLTVTVRLV